MTKPPGSYSITTTQLDRAIRLVSIQLGSEFRSGDCGVFAIELAKILGPANVSFEIECGSHYEMYDHVALRFKGKLFDGGGVTTLKRNGSIQPADGNDAEDHKVERVSYPVSPEHIWSVLRFTNPDAIFASRISEDVIGAALVKAITNELTHGRTPAARRR